MAASQLVKCKTEIAAAGGPWSPQLPGVSIFHHTISFVLGGKCSWRARG